MADGERLKPVEGVVLPPLADVIYQGTPFAAATRMQRVGCGTSVLDMVASQSIPVCFHPDVQVFIGDHEIARENWAVVRPKPGAEVFIRVNMRGGGGGGKDIMRAVAMIGIMVVAYMVAGPMANLLLGAVTMPAGVALATAGVAHGILSGVIAAGIMTAGQALVNALIPPPSAKSQWGFDQELGNPYGQITGLRNQAAPYGPIPRVFGKRRMFPMLAGRPYTENVGNDQYLRLLLLVGFGPLKISDIKLGETPISSIQGLEIETREGWENDAAVSLYTKAIQEDNFSIVMDGAGSTAIRTTRPNTKEISVEISFPSGVNRVKDNELRFHEVSMTVQYRPAGSNGAWTNADWATKVEAEGTKNAGILFTRDKTQNGLRRSGRWTVPVGQYDVKVTRTSPKEPMGETGYGLWTTLRSIVDTDFLPMKGLSLIAMKIKASGQLNGVPDQINCMVESYLPVYDGVSAWNWQVSRSPAWAYAHLLRYRGYQRIHDDSRIHLGEIKAWADACAAAPPNGTGPYWTFDGVVEGGSIFSNLRTVASHGRAAFHIKDGKYSVVRDTVQTVPVQSFSPRNSWGYAGSKVFSDLPHALRVRFPNEEKQFAEDEVIVYAPGYSRDGGGGTIAASTYETIDMPGCSRPSQAWREGMYHYAVLLLRPETHTIYADVENLRCQMGSFVRFSHDVIKIGLGWGRLTGVIAAGGNVTHLLLDGEVEMAVGKTYGIRCRKADFASAVMTLAPASNVITRQVQLQTPIPLANAPKAGDLFQFGESGLESAPMMVKRISPGPDLTAQITLVDAQPGVWSADSGVIPAFNTYITNPIPVERRQPTAPTMRLTSDSSTARYANDGTVIERVGVSFDALPSSETLIDYIQVQYRDVDSNDFIPLPNQPRNTAGFLVDGVYAGVSYEFRARSVTAFGIPSDWFYEQVQCAGKTVPPLPPVALEASAGLGSQEGQITLRWTLSTDADLWATEVWSSPDNNRANASLVARVADPGISYDHALTGPVDRYYWVRSIDLSGNFSTAWPEAENQWFPASATGGVLGQALANSGLTEEERDQIEGNTETIYLTQQQIAEEILRGVGHRAYVDGLMYLDSVPVGTVLAETKEEFTDFQGSYVQTMSLLGAKNLAGTGWILNADTVSLPSTSGGGQLQSLKALQLTTAQNQADIQQIFTVTDGFAEAKTLVVVNGYVSGIVNQNDGSVSSFKILADNLFAVAPNGGNPVTIFEYSGSELILTNTRINGNLAITGTFTNRAMANNTLNGLVVVDTNGTVTLAGTTNTKVQELIIVVEKSSSPVKLAFNGLLLMLHNAAGSFSMVAEFRRQGANGANDTLLRSRTINATGDTYDAVSGPLVFMLQDNPGQGTWRYYVNVRSTTNNMTTQTVTDPYMEAIEYKTNTT